MSNRQTKPRGRLLGVDVDRALIRQARLDAGLSMSQMAGTDLTRQAIFLIEAGKTRPSMRTLELIASRTGRPVQVFLLNNPLPGGPRAADARAGDLQTLCSQQRFDDAIALGLPMLEHTMAPRFESLVRHYVGQAFVRSNRPDEGLEHLRRAQALLEKEQDPWLAAECADWEACALYLKEDSRALAVAEKALRLCRETEPRLPGTEARILEHIATIHVKNHTYDLAVTFYEEALQAAGSTRDLARLGRTYHGLSIAYMERGELGRAIEYTHKALALYALERDTALLARGENELGLLLSRQGQLGRAGDAFRAALAHLEESGTQRGKSHVLHSLGELQLKTGQYNDGIETAKKAIDLAQQLDERLALADCHELLGRLYESKVKHELADKAFGAALRLLKKEGLNDRLAETHASYAELLEGRGDHEGASRHWKDAAKLALGNQAVKVTPAQAV
jgi:tetratricopeptide (TPR) repeat protein